LEAFGVMGVSLADLMTHCGLNPVECFDEYGMTPEEMAVAGILDLPKMLRHVGLDEAAERAEMYAAAMAGAAARQAAAAAEAGGVSGPEVDAAMSAASRFSMYSEVFVNLGFVLADPGPGGGGGMGGMGGMGGVGGGSGSSSTQGSPPGSPQQSPGKGDGMWLKKETVIEKRITEYTKYGMGGDVLEKLSEREERVHETTHYETDDGQNVAHRKIDRHIQKEVVDGEVITDEQTGEQFVYMKSGSDEITHAGPLPKDGAEGGGAAGQPGVGGNGPAPKGVGGAGGAGGGQWPFFGVPGAPPPGGYLGEICDGAVPAEQARRKKELDSIGKVEVEVVEWEEEGDGDGKLDSEMTGKERVAAEKARRKRRKWEAAEKMAAAEKAAAEQTAAGGSVGGSVGGDGGAGSGAGGDASIDGGVDVTECPAEGGGGGAGASCPSSGPVPIITFPDED
jgi:hypothetical protein